jgi:hypothetical protein
MRYYFLPLVLTVLAATAPSHANENNGVMIFKANKPYASPFDKPQGVSESPVLPSTLGSPPSGVDWSNPTPINVQELPSTHSIPVLTPPESATPSPVLRVIPKTKPEPAKEASGKTVKKENIAPVKPEVRKVEARKVEPAKKEETKPVAKLPQEESIVPPQALEKPTTALAPPPGAAPAVKIQEGGLTSFKTPSALTPAVSAASSPSSSPISEMASTTVDASPKELVNESTMPQDAPWLPWYLKAGVRKWLLHQATYGDPAYKDPWFSPARSNSLKF